MGVMSQRQLTAARREGGRLLRAITAVELVLSVANGSDKKCVKVLPVRGDFFTGEFCVNLGTGVAGGLHRLTVEAILLEGEGGRRWRLGAEGGAKASLTVRLEGGMKGDTAVTTTAPDFSQPLPIEVASVMM